MNKYLFKPTFGGIKQGFAMDSTNGQMVCEAKMLKFKLFGAAPFEFINYLTNKKEEHQIGKTVTQSLSGMTEFLSIKSSFKYDGKNIWYLHELGVRIDSKMSSGKLGMTYGISLKGKEIATLASTTPKGKALITNSMYYDVECDEDNLDLVFLVTFAIARTDQGYYD